MSQSQSIAEERWLPIPGYEGYYEVSDQGRVRSLDRTTITIRLGTRVERFYPGRLLKLRVTSKRLPYYRVSICSGTGNKVTMYTHRLVLQAFVGAGADNAEACHVNGDPHDNRLENLYWGDASTNGMDRVRHGRNAQANQTECVHGHAYTEANTQRRRRPNGKFERNCRACNRIRQKQIRQRNRARAMAACLVLAAGTFAAAALTPAPVANAYPSCGLGILSVSTPFGGYCDTPPIEPQGQHFHCQWGVGFELCEYRWADNTAAPFPGQSARFGAVLR